MTLSSVMRGKSWDCSPNAIGWPLVNSEATDLANQLILPSLPHLPHPLQAAMSPVPPAVVPEKRPA